MPSLLALFLLVLTGLSLVSSLPAYRLQETNAQRFSRGLRPAPPKRLFSPSRRNYRRDTAADAAAALAACRARNPQISGASQSFLLRVQTATNATFGYIHAPPPLEPDENVSFPGSGAKSSAGCFKLVSLSGNYLTLVMRSQDESVLYVHFRELFGANGAYYPYLAHDPASVNDAFPTDAWTLSAGTKPSLGIAITQEDDLPGVYLTNYAPAAPRQILVVYGTASKSFTRIQLVPEYVT